MLRSRGGDAGVDDKDTLERIEPPGSVYPPRLARSTGSADTAPMLDPDAGPEAPTAEDDLPWDARIRRLVDFGVDETIIVENLRRTPSERLQRMLEMARFVEENRGRGR